MIIIFKGRKGRKELLFIFVVLRQELAALQVRQRGGMGWMVAIAGMTTKAAGRKDGGSEERALLC